MATLTKLIASHGFTAGDLDTSGYVAAISAFQKVYFADGRIANDNGYHKLDFISTKIIAANGADGALTAGEIVTQAGSGAKGIYIENPSTTLAGTVSSGPFTVGELVTQASSNARGYVINAAADGANPLYVYATYGTFVTSQNVTGASSSAVTNVATSVSAAGRGHFHFIYRTDTTEFNNSGEVTGATSGKKFTSTATPVTPPHWIPWVLTDGTFPDGGSNIGCLCFGRIFLNSMLNPHQWYCTRVFDPLDLDSSQTDVAAATYSQSAKAGEVGDAIVAMVSYKDHYLIWGCANEVWVLQSDPLMGGVNRCISKATGIFSPTSYCWDDKNNLYFMGTDGIYRLSAEAIINAAPPENITKEHNPKLISSLGLNRRTDRVAMGYDKKRYGIKVAVTQQDGLWAVNWWMDLRTGGVFPEKFTSLQDAASLFYFDSYKNSERGLLIGGYDGYIRKEDEGETDDDGDNAIESHVVIGPYTAEGEPREEIGINETSLVLGEESDGVTVDFHKGTSADEVVANVLAEETPFLTKTLSDDSLKNSIIDRVAGRAVAVKIENEENDETFSMESINISFMASGRKD